MRTAKIIQNGPSTGHTIHPEAELEITLEAEQLGKEDDQNPQFRFESNGHAGEHLFQPREVLKEMK